METLLENKREYITHLCDLIAEKMVHQLQNLYVPEGSQKFRSPLENFQNRLATIPEWNNDMVHRLRQELQGSCEYLDDLVKAIFKVSIQIHLVLIGKTKDNVKMRVPSTDSFLHQCLVEFARSIWKKPYLFYHNVRSLEKQRNYEICEKIARKAIQTTIRNKLPMSDIVTHVSKTNEEPDERPQDSESDEVDDSNETDTESETETETETDDETDTDDNEKEVEAEAEAEAEEDADAEAEGGAEAEPEPDADSEPDLESASLYQTTANLMRVDEVDEEQQGENVIVTHNTTNHDEIDNVEEDNNHYDYLSLQKGPSVNHESSDSDEVHGDSDDEEGVTSGGLEGLREMGTFGANSSSAEDTNTDHERIGTDHKPEPLPVDDDDERREPMPATIQSYKMETPKSHKDVRHIKIDFTPKTRKAVAKDAFF